MLSVRKLGAPCVSGLQGPSGVPGGEATSQRPPCGRDPAAPACGRVMEKHPPSPATLREHS